MTETLSVANVDAGTARESPPPARCDNGDGRQEQASDEPGYVGEDRSLSHP